MGGTNIQAVEFAFLFLLLFVVVFVWLARKVEMPYPIVLVIAGAILALVPGIPRVSLNPDVVFYVVLPPLLYSAAWTTSWRDFRFHLVSILMLAIGLVAFTVIGVAAGAPLLMDGFNWKLGLILGAIVAPTDALAATSIARRVGLPKRLIDILEGESLVNDATGLLALEFGIAMVVRNQTPTVSEGILRFVFLTVGGIVVGVATGWIVDHIERFVDDGPIEIAISILVPYAAYFTADSLHASGVLAVVTCGLILSRRSSSFFSASVRLQIWPVWESLTFILNGLVFLMIGLQMPLVMAGIHEYSARTLWMYGATFSALVIALRLIWIFPGGFFANRIRTRILHQNEPMPPPRTLFIAGWSGMRGVIALAAALALPQMLPDGSPFPQRSMIIFLSFSVILVTLVLQGLTLPPLVRRLGIAGVSGPDLEKETAKREILEAALAYIEDERKNDKEAFAGVYEDFTHHYRERLLALGSSPGDDTAFDSGHHERHASLSRELLRVERNTALRLRKEGRISDEVLRHFERDLDLRETAHSPVEH